MIGSTVLMTLGTGLMALARPDNIGPVIVILIIAGLGIGGILVPASIITTIVCPDDLIATVSALTLSIRVLGGAVGYAVYYNVFFNKFVVIASSKQLQTCQKCAYRDSCLDVLAVVDDTARKACARRHGKSSPKLLCKLATPSHSLRPRSLAR